MACSRLRLRSINLSVVSSIPGCWSLLSASWTISGSAVSSIIGPLNGCHPKLHAPGMARVLFALFCMARC